MLLVVLECCLSSVSLWSSSSASSPSSPSKVGYRQCHPLIGTFLPRTDFLRTFPGRNLNIAICYILVYLLEMQQMQSFLSSCWRLREILTSVCHAVTTTLSVTATLCGGLSTLSCASMVFLLLQGEIRLQRCSGLLTVWVGLYPWMKEDRGE